MSTRLAPVEKPRGIAMKLAYWMSRRSLGKVMTPLKVFYARAPYLARLAYSMANAVEKKVRLDPELRLLVQAQASAHNGCGFCLDMKSALALQHGLGLEKFQQLAGYRESPLFSDRERAALDYAGEVNRSRRVSDETFERLRKHFSDEEIVEITFVNAVENYYNLTAIPLGIESDGLCALAQERACA